MNHRRIILVFILFMVFTFNLDVFAASEINEDEIKKEIISLSINKKLVNDGWYTLESHNRITLIWDEIPNVSKTIIYRYNYKNKKFEKLKVLKNQNTYSVSKLSPLTTYKFKVKVCDDNGNSISSNILSVKTRNKTNGYFYNKCIFDGTWDNILITTQKATNERMNKYKVNNTKPFVKYNYSINDKILYIHIYSKFEGEGINQKFKLYDRNGKCIKTYNKTYKQVVCEGIKNRYEIKVKGNNYDFIPGCNFKTKVILHTNIKDSEQYCTTFKIGTDAKYEGDYWFFATISLSGKYYEVILPTQYQLYLNKNLLGPFDTMTDYKSAVAHELGHNLGLADSYELDNDLGRIKRVNKNTETGYYQNKEFKSLMYGSKGVCKVRPNDIEMMIQSQSESTGAGNIPQYYRTHYNYDYDGTIIKNIKSKVIRK